MCCWFLLLLAANAACFQLPDTSGIDGELTANLAVDRFFSLWLVFNNEEVQMSGEPFTILAPRNTAGEPDKNVLTHPELVKKIVLDHVLLGTLIDLTNVTAPDGVTFKTVSGRSVHVKPNAADNTKLYANGVLVLEPKVVVPNGILVVVADYLFADERPRGVPNATAAAVLSTSSPPPPPKTTAPVAVTTVSPAVTHAPLVEPKSVPPANASFIENISQVLSFLKSGVRVFQHFLSRSNVSRMLNDGEEYTVFVPTDHAFQRWHPIDWGFYPFSVPEFTESVMVNHFVRGNIRQDNIKDGQIAKTLGGREIMFRKAATLTVNGAMIVKGDTPVIRGNIMFISEVLFVSESVVSRLHQQHRDKETPPLLAFPWFGAQFLSHAFLALERDRRFSHITRFLNLADLAPHVSGTGYTFFVPTDSAFAKLGLDKMPDNYLSTGAGLQILLNHFVKGRLYDKDLKDGTNLVSLGNKTIHVHRKDQTVTINEATIVESEVFVYNLGTMFYIDTVLFTNPENLPGSATSTTVKPTSPPPEAETVKDSDAGKADEDKKKGAGASATTASPTAAPEDKVTTAIDIEPVPEELAEETGSLPDVLLGDAEAVTGEPILISSSNMNHSSLHRSHRNATIK